MFEFVHKSVLTDAENQFNCDHSENYVYTIFSC